MTKGLILDPDKPPCPWCLKQLGLKQALYHHKTAYCCHCKRCVVKYLSVSGGDLVSPGEERGWYWSKHQAHRGEIKSIS